MTDLAFVKLGKVIDVILDGENIGYLFGWNRNNWRWAVEFEDDLEIDLSVVGAIAAKLEELNGTHHQGHL